jgi:hypothetical protein
MYSTIRARFAMLGRAGLAAVTTALVLTNTWVTALAAEPVTPALLDVEEGRYQGKDVV